MKGEKACDHFDRHWLEALNGWGVFWWHFLKSNWMGSQPLFGNPLRLKCLKFLLCGWSLSLEGNLPELSEVELVIGKSPTSSAMRAKLGNGASGSECRLLHFFCHCLQPVLHPVSSCQFLEFCWFILCVLPESTSLLSAGSYTPPYALQLWNFSFLFSLFLQHLEHMSPYLALSALFKMSTHDLDILPILSGM